MNEKMLFCSIGADIEKFRIACDRLAASCMRSSSVFRDATMNLIRLYELSRMNEESKVSMAIFLTSNNRDQHRIMRWKNPREAMNYFTPEKLKQAITKK